MAPAAAHHLVSAGSDSTIRRHRDRRAPLAALIAAGAAVCLAVGTGVGLAATTDRGAGSPAVASWYPGCGDGCPSATAAPTATPQGPPTRVRVPKIGVDSALTVLGLDRAGTLIPPVDFDTAGWYGAARPPATPARRCSPGTWTRGVGQRSSPDSVSCARAMRSRCGAAASGCRSG
ncbi:hypothetical protein GCM10027614_27080 [Micromonospora vulcania]